MGVAYMGVAGWEGIGVVGMRGQAKGGQAKGGLFLPLGHR